jgi:ABC-type multidrug transport system fused ATPase/permease subunit
MSEDNKSLPDNSNSKEEYLKVGFFETIKISRWSILLLYKSLPIHTIIFFISEILLDVKDVIYTFIYAKALDELLKVIQLPNASVTQLYPYLGAFLAYSLLNSIVRFSNRYVWNVIRMKSNTFLRRELYLRMNELGIQTLEQPEINNKIHRANDYIYNVLPYMQESISFIAQLISLVTIGILLASFLPIFLVIIVITSIPYLFTDKSFRKKIYKIGYENTQKQRRSSEIAGGLSSPVSLQEITTTNAFLFFDKEFLKFRIWYEDIRLKIIAKHMKVSYSFGILNDLVIFWGYIKIFERFLSKTISIGSVVFWMRNLSSFEGSLSQTISTFNDLSEFALQIKDVYLIFTYEKIYPNGGISLPLLNEGPEIEFRNLTFNYPNSEKKVLREINLKIRKGERIAIVGPNGAGKTTLVKLISRFYKIDQGQILINSLDINDINSESLYENMGTLLQDFNTYSALTVKENICVGKPKIEPNEEIMRMSAKAADALDFIEEYPEGFNTIMSERYKGGIRPSTGQWQKIALARFFYRNSPLVIFDEPTASIDAVSEYHIFSKIYNFFEGKTVIIISHRFSTVRNADRIIVLDKGEIVEEGSHDELIKLNGKYAEGFRLQAEGYTE